MTLGDIEVLRQLATAGSDLSKPHQVHAAALGPGWCIHAEHMTALLPPDVEAFRELFTRLAEQFSDEYDGWEAAMVPLR